MASALPKAYIGLGKGPAMADRPDSEGRKVAKRPPLKARPQRDVDVDALVEDISERFSETLKYLGR